MSLAKKHRLEIICQPETVFYNDENGQSASLMVGVVLRAKKYESRYSKANSVQLLCELCFDDTHETIFNHEIRTGRKVRRIFTIQDPSSLVIHPKTFSAIVKFRVDRMITKKVDDRKFTVKISCGSDPNMFDPIYTEPFEVRTKRKNVTGQERLPEISARNKAERALREVILEVCHRLPDVSNQHPNNYERSFREIFQVKPIEALYPVMEIAYEKKKSSSNSSQESMPNPSLCSIPTDTDSEVPAESTKEISIKEIAENRLDSKNTDDDLFDDISLSRSCSLESKFSLDFGSVASSETLIVGSEDNFVGSPLKLESMVSNPVHSEFSQTLKRKNTQLTTDDITFPIPPYFYDDCSSPPPKRQNTNCSIGSLPFLCNTPPASPGLKSLHVDFQDLDGCFDLDGCDDSLPSFDDFQLPMSPIADSFSPWQPSCTE